MSYICIDNNPNNMKLIETIENGKKGSEILQQGDIFLTFNFPNLKGRVTSVSYPSKDFKTIGGARRYANKFLSL